MKKTMGTDKPLKIVQVVSGADEVAGVQKHVAYLAKHSKYEHHVFTKKAPRFEAFLAEQGLAFSSFNGPLDFILKMHKLKPSVIHAHLGQAVILGALFVFLRSKIPLIYSQHLLMPQSELETGMKRWFKKVVFKFAFSRVSRYICVSETVKTSVLQRNEHPSPEVIYNGVPSQPWVERSYDFARRPMRVIGVCRLENEKKPLNFIHLAQELNDKSFVIDVYGSGSLYEELNNKASILESSTKLQFHGYSKYVLNEMKKADVFIHFCDVEAFGLVLIEAMSCGLGVLAPKKGGHIDFFSQDAFLSDSDDISGYAKALKDFYANPDWLIQSSKSLYEKAGKFSSAVMIEKMDFVYFQSNKKNSLN